MTIPKLLSTQLLTALQTVLGAGLPVDFAPAVTPSQDLRFGDYQSNAAMMLLQQKLLKNSVNQKLQVLKSPALDSSISA